MRQVIQILVKSARQLFDDSRGTSMLDFTIVFPTLALVAFGMVDAGLILSQWNAAVKATHLGVRRAVVVDPVVTIDWAPLWTAADIGKNCTLANGTSAGVCPTVTRTDCFVGNSGQGACTIDPANVSFLNILTEMRRVMPNLQPAEVRIDYGTSGLGFVGRPGGLPMTVSVSIRCRAFRTYFLGPLMGWAAPANNCGPVGYPIPPSRAVLIGEDMATN